MQKLTLKICLVLLFAGFTSCCNQKDTYTDIPPDRLFKMKTGDTIVYSNGIGYDTQIVLFDTLYYVDPIAGEYKSTFCDWADYEQVQKTYTTNLRFICTPIDQVIINFDSIEIYDTILKDFYYINYSHTIYAGTSIESITINEVQYRDLYSFILHDGTTIVYNYQFGLIRVKKINCLPWEVSKIILH